MVLSDTLKFRVRRLVVSVEVVALVGAGLALRGGEGLFQEMRALLRDKGGGDGKI